MISDLIEKTVKATTQPIKDGVEILEGLSEGEIRQQAIARLGVDVVAGMGIAELIEVLKEEQN
jgi:hypothetical protein